MKTMEAIAPMYALITGSCPISGITPMKKIRLYMSTTSWYHLSHRLEPKRNRMWLMLRSALRSFRATFSSPAASLTGLIL